MRFDNGTLGFLHAAQANPRHVALTDERHAINYATLRTRALELAGRLIACGVVPGDVVAVTCDRSAESVVAILGVICAGAAYLPLDISYPPARLASMLQDAKPRLVVRIPGAGIDASHLNDCTVVGSSFDGDDGIDALSEPVAVSPTMPAYVLFTSGSTGRPKGVVIPRSALDVMVAWHRDHPRLGQPARALQFASLGFDASVRDIFATFAVGGTLMMASDDERRDPFRLLGRMHAERIERASLPYVALRAIAQAHAGGGALPQSLRDVSCGGEALVITPAIRSLFAALPGAVLYNEYGPTETCVLVTSHALSGEPARWPDQPDLGHALAHVRLQVVDASLHQLPDHTEGELLIGGETLADGYIHQPDLTDGRFVLVDDGSGQPRRMYRSGDLVRRTIDGRIVFAGRVDDQVKIAGNRVEPVEIEATLAGHPAVRDAVVVAPQGENGRHLVAHIVTADGTSASDALRGELMRHLALHLPAFARPQRLVFRNELPWTPHGKIDRRRLEDEGRGAQDAGPVGADAPLQERIAALWSKLLSIPMLDVDENVFDQGADSLQVMMFVTRLRTITGQTLGATTIYAEPTPRRQAQMLLVAPISSGPVMELHPQASGELPQDVPLSESQMEKWFASQFGRTASLAFNESSTLRLDGVLDGDAFRRAITTVWRRHEVLHFSFAADGTHQHFHADVPLPLNLLNYAEPAEQAERRLAAFCAQQAAQPFDMTMPPLVRFTLIRLGPQQHVLHVIAHHLVMDGWSLAIFVNELSACYNAYVKGRVPQLPAAGSFRRYLMAERERRASGRSTASLDYWKRLYATPPSALRLPADRPATSQPDYAAKTEQHELSPVLADALRRLARQRGVSFYSLLLSGFGVMVARLSGQDDFAIAVPFAGLALADDEVLMGDGVSALPLRMRVDTAWPFGELATRTHAALMDAAEHQDVTLTGIQRALGLRATGGEVALSGVTFSLLPRASSAHFEGLGHELRESPRAALDWDISFTIADTGAALVFDLHYATARYDAITMRRWIGFYEAVLSTIAALDGASATHDVAVGDIDLLDAAGRDEVLRSWNATGRDYNRDHGLTQLIEAQMRQTPERIAAECNGQQLDYAGLERSTRALAQALARRGIGRGDMVGICVPRSLDMLLAVLGVLRSGAAYVPLDPEFPDTRLRHMAEHSRLRYVLMSELDLVPTVIASSRELLAVEELAAEPFDLSPLPVVRGDDLAYVLFTSGSTGEPKGVRILHRNLVNFLLSMRDEPGFTAEDVLCAVTTLSFDIAGLELYLPLIAGGRLVIATEALHREPSSLFELIEKTGCTVLQTTPSLLQLLQGIGHEDVVRQLRLFVGGEALPLPLAHTMADQCREFWNLYGPTETTIWSTLTRIHADAPSIALGKPIANTQIYILDGQNRPVAPGVTGEIWIGGDGVSDGYLYRPELTAERFVNDPFFGGAARMYRTGDLGSWREGVLYFHGRADNQIKIRGYRIEPGDIEAAAGSDPAVHECVVVARRFGENDVRLVLYVVTDQRDRTYIEHLRDLLRHRLPAYMRPQHIECLDALPKTPNGKIDRNALPQPSSSKVSEMSHEQVMRAVHRMKFIDPRQAYLASVWCELVGATDVRVSDNFFDVGGHSLLAVEMVARVEKETGVRLKLLDVATGSLASLAQELPGSDGDEPSGALSLGTRLRNLFGFGGGRS